MCASREGGTGSEKLISHEHRAFLIVVGSLDKRLSEDMARAVKRDKAARREAAKLLVLGSNPNQCRCCKVGKMVTVGVLLPARAPPVVGEELKNVIWIEQ